LYEVEIVAEVGARITGVLTVKEALVAPAGMKTVKGTLAANPSCKERLGRYLPALAGLR
jgi:hypothetical protein